MLRADPATELLDSWSVSLYGFCFIQFVQVLLPYDYLDVPTQL
jgi:hypothetical protein